MISGTVTELLDAILRLTIQGPDGRSQRIESILDTGFSGSLTLPISAIQSLQLPWIYRQQGMLADGSIHPFDVYVATIVWDGRERTIEVETADVEPLLGMSLLKDHQLKIDVRAGGQVTIEPMT